MHNRMQIVQCRRMIMPAFARTTQHPLDLFENSERMYNMFVCVVAVAMAAAFSPAIQWDEMVDAACSHVPAWCQRLLAIIIHCCCCCCGCCKYWVAQACKQYNATPANADGNELSSGRRWREWAWPAWRVIFWVSLLSVLFTVCEWIGASRGHGHRHSWE